MPLILRILIQPAIDALSPFSHIPFQLRFRLLAFQPLTFLTHALIGLPYQFRRRTHKIIHVPLPKSRGGGSIRCMVFQPPETSDSQLKPLHISIHGGAFISGFAENTASFCESLSQRAGCVAIGISYRFAPRHAFPTAHDDVRDVVRWICQHAEEKWGADGTRVTVSGSSAGGNLGLDLAISESERKSLTMPVVEGWVGFCTPTDLSTPPWEKPAPAKFPKRNPLEFLLPLFHAYGASASAVEPTSKRANPYLRHDLSDLPTLPKNMLFIVAGIDILSQEQLEYVHTLQSSIARAKGAGFEVPDVESEVYENSFHGSMELPNFLLRNPTCRVEKYQALAKALGFLENIIRQSRDQTS